MDEKYFGSFDWNYADIGCVPEQRIVFEPSFNNPGINFKSLPWGKEHLEELIQEGKVIKGISEVVFRQHGANVSYLPRVSYQFTEEAEEEWQDILEERINAFDFF